MKHILNIEGIPGAGKSHGAQWLHQECQRRGIESFWVLEETNPHPLGSGHIGADVACSASAFISSWQRFIQTNLQFAILDGYAFQCTVRHLFAKNATMAQMRDYFDEWEHIALGRTSIVFIEVPSPQRHYRDFVFPLRGQAWTRKVSNYVARTDYGMKHGLTGKAGLIEFWSAYQSCCLELLERSQSLLKIQSSRDLSWVIDHLQRVMDNEPTIQGEVNAIRRPPVL